MRVRLIIGAVCVLLVGWYFLPDLTRIWVTLLETTPIGSSMLAKGFVQPKRVFNPDAWKQVGLVPQSYQLDLGNGIQTHALYVPAAGEAKGTVILLHGYANCMDITAWLARHVHDAGYNTISFDQRGHGHNTAPFCTFGCQEKQDVSTAISFLESHGIGQKPYMIIGTSMGAAIGIQAMAIDNRIRCGVFDSSFDTLSHVAPKWLADAGVHNPQAVIKAADDLTDSAIDSVSPDSAIRGIDRPVFILHGRDDTMIPMACAEALYSDAPSPKKRIQPIEHANHSQVLADQEPWTSEVWTAIIKFLDENRT